MTRVVLVEFDEALRGVLSDILAVDSSFSVTEVSEGTEAVERLATMAEGVIVVVSNRDAHHQRSAVFFAAVAANEQLLTRHQYLMLSTNPREMPAGLQGNLMHLQATILAKPFDMDTLLAAMDAAAARLVAVPAPVRDSHHEE